MKCFVIILSLIVAITVIGISTSTIDAVPPLDSQFVYDASEVILVGRVTSVNSTFSPTHNLYQIEVEKYLKNQLDTDMVLAAGQNTVIAKIGNQVFKPGDRVLFFLSNDTINYDGYTGIFGVSYESKLVEPQWDQCNIFEKSIPAEHWIFGGRGPTPKISQQNNTDAENFLVGKKVLIAYDLFNHTPDEKNIDVGIQIKNLDDPNSLYVYTEISRHLLKACTAYETLSWNFTPTKSGRYSVEFYDLRGSQMTIGFTAREQIVPKSQYGDSPLKQIKSGIPFNEIQCKKGLELIFKTSDGSPTCVKLETKQKLIERGWAKSEHLSRLVEPEHIPDPICFVIGKATSGEKGGAMTQDTCFPLSDFESLGCDRSILEYIYKYTNLLEGEFDGNYVRNMVGLPEGVSEEEYEKCADSIYEKRKSMSENMEFESFSIVEGTKIQLEGIIMDMRLEPDHQYSFFTNDSNYSFNTGSEGITLEGINNEDDLHGKIVTLSGIRTQRDLGIKVDDLVVTGSLIPSPITTNPVLTAKDILDVSLDTLYENPDQYYGRFVRIAGDLSEYETGISYTGVGCYTAKYTTSDEFVSDFPSSRHLHNDNKNIGVRIDTPDDLGRVKEPLPDELKMNKVTIMGIFIPNVVEKGDCDHVIHKSGFLLTKLDDIKIDG